MVGAFIGWTVLVQLGLHRLPLALAIGLAAVISMLVTSVVNVGILRFAYRPIAGRRGLRAQLEYLLEVTALPNVSVQVLPWHLSGFAAEGAFALLRFAEPELPNITYVKHLTGALFLEKLDEIEAYSRSLDRLAVDAETPDRSRQLLSKRLAEI